MGGSRRCSEREPADSLRDKSNVIGGWLPSLTFALGVVVSLRTHKIVIGILVCLLALLLSGYWALSRQMVWAGFIDAQCRTTQESFIDESAGPQALALRLDFLMGYYEAHSKALAGSRLESIVRREYHQTLTNAVAAFRSMTTNDLGADPRVWIQKYEQ
jgi:hypothetical protein